MIIEGDSCALVWQGPLVQLDVLRKPSHGLDTNKMIDECFTQMFGQGGVTRAIPELWEIGNDMTQLISFLLVRRW